MSHIIWGLLGCICSSERPMILTNIESLTCRLGRGPIRDHFFLISFLKIGLEFLGVASKNFAKPNENRDYNLKNKQ